MVWSKRFGVGYILKESNFAVLVSWASPMGFAGGNIHDKQDPTLYWVVI